MSGLTEPDRYAGDDGYTTTQYRMLARHCQCLTYAEGKRIYQ